MTSFDDSFLTTDACPNYPEDNATSKNVDDNTNETAPRFPDKEETEEIEETVYEQVEETKRTSKSKTKKINNQAYANVINISNSNSIHIGSNITINHSPTKPQKKNHNFMKTKAVDLLMTNSDTVTTKDIMFVSANIGEGWRNLFRMLNYIEAQIDQFYETHIQKGIKEVIYQILLDWIQNEADNATMSNLTNALWNSDHKDVVYQMSIK